MLTFCFVVSTGCRDDVLLQHLLSATLCDLQRADAQGPNVFPPRDCIVGQTHQSQTQKML